MDEEEHDEFINYDYYINDDQEDKLISGKEIVPKVLFFKCEILTNRSLHISCRAIGNPPVDITLVFPNKEKLIEPRMDRRLEFNLVHMGIFNKTPNEIGTYNCFAGNSHYNSTTAECRVKMPNFDVSNIGARSKRASSFINVLFAMYLLTL